MHAMHFILLVPYSRENPMLLREWMISKQYPRKSRGSLQETDIWILLAHMSKNFKGTLHIGVM